MNTKKLSLKEKLTSTLLNGLDKEKIENLIKKYKTEHINHINYMYRMIMFIFIVSFLYLLIFAPFINLRDFSVIKYIIAGITVVIIVFISKKKILSDLKEIQESPYAKENLLLLQNRLKKIIDEETNKRNRIKKALKEMSDSKEAILEKYNLKEFDLEKFYKEYEAVICHEYED